MKRVCALVAIGVGCAIAGVTFASGADPHGLKPRALAFMRSVSLPQTPVPPSVRRAFAAHPHAGRPRLAGTLRAPGGRIALWVAPLGGRGWCEGVQWPRMRFDGVNCHWVGPASQPFGGGFVGPSLFAGRAAVTNGRELRLLFADGGSVRIPTRDGFYLYRVPDERVIRSRERALVLRARGRELARYRLGPLFLDRPSVGGGARRPSAASAARERRLLSATTRLGRVALMTAPSRFVPATCWWLQVRLGSYGGSCVRNDRDTSSVWSATALRVRIHGDELWVLWGRVGRRFASLQLRYQDGRRLVLPRRNGFFLHVVRGPDRVPGRRPAQLVGLDTQGRPLRKELLLTFAWAR